MKKIQFFVITSLLILNSMAQNTNKDTTTLLLRCDDFGLCHAVNMAFEEIFENNIPVSVSTIFVSPWYQEAVEILKKHPEVSVGVHLTLTSEWKNYKWGPILGKEAVPSLVNSNGYFFYSNDLFLANKPKLKEVEKELRAQIERALNSGIKIDYVDAHMFTAVSTPALKKLVWSLANEYNLGISEGYGEELTEIFFIPYKEKKDTMLAKIEKFEAGKDHLLVCHPGKDWPEFQAMEDINPTGLTSDVSKHRQAVLDAILSDEFRDCIIDHHIKLTTYREYTKQNKPIMLQETSGSY
jgi:chitin disaccharide deacetylase